MQSMRTLITTVGTSVLTNHRRAHPGEVSPATNKVLEWVSRVGPTEACAATNSWHRLDALGDRETRIVLVHSSTIEGRLASEILLEYAKSHGAEALHVEVPRLAAAAADQFNQALASLARIICDEVRKAERHGWAEIVATGGYKAETAVANLIGALLEIPVHYIHESFKEIVTFKPLPVSFNLTWLQEDATAKLLDKLAAGDKHCLTLDHELRSLLNRDERLWLLVETVNVGETVLAEATHLGEIALAMRGEAPVQWPPGCPTPPHKKVHLETSHHKPAGWKSFLDTLAGSAYTTSIRFDGKLGKEAGLFVGPAQDSISDIAASLGDQKSPPLRLRVATTAECEKQRQMIIRVLKSELGIR